MLFRVFDRADVGSFGQAEFVDVISKRMRPNYKRIIAAERERFRMFGLDIKFPKKKEAPKPRVIVKTVEKIVERIIEKPVEKIVTKVVEKIVEVPKYIDKIVEVPAQAPQVRE